MVSWIHVVVTLLCHCYKLHGSGDGFTVTETVAVNNLCLLCHVPHVIPHHTALHISHTSQRTLHVPHLPTHPTPHAPHSTYPTQHSRPRPLHPSRSLFRVQRDRESRRIPVHYDTPTPLHLVEGMSLHPSSDYMGWNLSFHLSFMLCVEHLSPVNIVLMRCWDVLTLYIIFIYIIHIHGDNIIVIVYNILHMYASKLHIKYTLSRLSYFIQFAMIKLWRHACRCVQIVFRSACGMAYKL